MEERNYLVGTRREKDTIQSLLDRHQPAFINYSFPHLCRYFVNLLYENGSNSPDDFDFTVIQFLDELEVDVCEISGRWQPGTFRKYIVAVEETLGYLRFYMENLEIFPLPDEIKVEEGSPNSVLRLTLVTR